MHALTGTIPARVGGALGLVPLTLGVHALVRTVRGRRAGVLLVSRHGLVRVLERYSQWIVPAVFILLGLYILNSSGRLLGAIL